MSNNGSLSVNYRIDGDNITFKDVEVFSNRPIDLYHPLALGTARAASIRLTENNINNDNDRELGIAQRFLKDKQLKQVFDFPSEMVEQGPVEAEAEMAEQQPVEAEASIISDENNDVGPIESAEEKKGTIAEPPVEVQQPGILDITTGAVKDTASAGVDAVGSIAKGATNFLGTVAQGVGNVASSATNVASSAASGITSAVTSEKGTIAEAPVDSNAAVTASQNTDVTGPPAGRNRYGLLNRHRATARIADIGGRRARGKQTKKGGRRNRTKRNRGGKRRTIKQ